MLSVPPPSGPLFNRVIIRSGILGPITAPISEEEGTKVFEKICSNANTQEHGKVALEALRNMDVQAIINASDAYTSQENLWRPVADPTFFYSDVVWDNVPKLLGECE